MKNLISRIKSTNSTENVKKARSNTKISAWLLKMPLVKTNNLLENSRTSITQSDSVRLNSTNPPSNVKTSEKITLIWPMKTKFWTLKLISAFWAFWTTSESTRTYKRKLRTTLNAMSRPDTCWTERKPWEDCLSRWAWSCRRPRRALPICADHSTHILNELW